MPRAMPLAVLTALMLPGLAACANRGAPRPAPDAPAVLVRQSAYEVDLGAVAYGGVLTFAQEHAVQHFVRRTSHGNPYALHVSIVAHRGLPAADTGRTLVESGVPPANIALFDAPPSMPARTIRLIAEAYAAVPPTCGLLEDDPFKSREAPELGCALDAALAVQVADPYDLIGRPNEGQRTPAALVVGALGAGATGAGGGGAIVPNAGAAIP